MMKKTIFVLIIIMFIMVVSFAGASDWIYKLPNGFEIWHFNGTDIEVLLNDEGGHSKWIPQYVKEFAHDDRYVLTRNVAYIQLNDIYKEFYYILDTKEQTLYGPFYNMDDLKSNTEKLGIDIRKWQRTSPAPKGAYQ